MNKKVTRFYSFIFIVILLSSLLALVGCTSSPKSEFYDAGNSDLNVTGSQFNQYIMFRFDTSTSAHTMTLPSAADIVANLAGPFVGDVIFFVVVADGNNPVTLIAGPNDTIKSGGSAVAGNNTSTMYFELDNISSGSEAVTIY